MNDVGSKNESSKRESIVTNTVGVNPIKKRFSFFGFGSSPEPKNDIEKKESFINVSKQLFSLKIRSRKESHRY